MDQKSTQDRILTQRIFGVDIASGSPRSRHPPSYALYVLEGEEGDAFNMISRHKLIRMIRDKKPNIVAVDNVHELASSKDDLIALLKQLPPTTKLVQVTGGERLQALTKLARWNGITFDRLNPSDEAQTCARLAAKGVGHVLLAFEDKTWIKVSRRRSPGRGGWSQNRYTRKIHGAVKSLSRDVEKSLVDSQLNYSSKVVEGLGGYIRCEFVVDAPRERVPIRSGIREDAQIRVEGVERPRLQYRPLKQRRGYIIVGIDPGTTTGIAALNLSGELVDVVSSRTMSSSDVIEWMAARGKPLIVATDVFPTPGAVEKIKRAFNAVLYSPGDSVPAEDKIAMARPFGYKNDHERDALSAALGAFKKYRNKFIQVEKKAPQDIDPEEVKALVVSGYSIDKALSKLSPQLAADTGRSSVSAGDAASSSSSQVPDGSQASTTFEEMRSLQEQVRHLREYVDELKADLSKKDESLAVLQKHLDRMKDAVYREARRDKEVKIRDKEIQRLTGMLRHERKAFKKLKSQNSRYRKAQKLEEISGLRRLKPIDAFSKDSVLDSSRRWNIGKGDIVILEDASGGGSKAADVLIDLGVEAVVTRGMMPSAAKDYMTEKGLPVLQATDLMLRSIDGISFVSPANLEKAINNWKEDADSRRAEEKRRWLESMIEEYRVERKREEKLELAKEKGRG